MNTTPANPPPSDRAYWFAIQLSPRIVPSTFGPYILTLAELHRSEWLKSMPPNARISAVFRSNSREEAEKSAIVHMAPW